jgi:hypothetical protein
MKYVKGQSGNPNGRGKNVPNKTTAEVKAWIMEIITNNQETFENNLKSLDADKHVAIIEKLLSFVLPKGSTVEITEPQPIIYKINVVDAETKTALEKITSGDFNEPEDGQHKIEVGSMETAQKLARWLNDEPMPQPAQSETSFRRQNDIPPVEVPPAGKIENTSLSRINDIPPPAPAPAPSPYRMKSAYRQNRI